MFTRKIAGWKKGFPEEITTEPKLEETAEFEDKTQKVPHKDKTI